MDSCNSYEACQFVAADGGFISKIVGSCNEFRSCSAAAYGFNIGNPGNITLGIVDSCNARKACYYVANPPFNNDPNYVTPQGGNINTIDNACNSDYACYKAAGKNVGDIPSGIIGCCNTGNATSPTQGICYQTNETTLFTQDPTCPVSAPISVSATADSGPGSDLINKDEVALDEFLLDLEHEIYNLVKELAKNKKD